MSVPDWSTTAADNDDADATINWLEGQAPGTVNNSARAMMAAIASFTRRGSDLASAATLNLDSVDTMLLNVTGTTTVTAVTLTTGHWRIVRATGAFQMTASASLIVNGSTSVNYTTVAEDLLMFEGYGSSVVRVWVMNPSKTALGLPSSTTDNAISRYDGTGGALQNSAVLIDDTGNIVKGTSDGSDNGSIAMGGGGAISAARGGDVVVYGNEHATNPGIVLLEAGTGASVQVFGGPFVPNTSDASALGTTSKMWSDLFLASGGVINWNAGNLTWTHSAGQVTANGNLYIDNASAAAVVLDKGAATDTAIYGGRKAGTNRWEVVVGNNTDETGSNVGSDFTINRYNDAGTFQDSPFFIERSTGRISISKGQITFPAAQNASSDANTLDDYEEGTWTPTISATSGTITTTTLSGCTYTKVGNKVSAWGQVTIDNNGTGAGGLVVTLPFTAGAPSVGVAWNASTSVQVGGHIAASGTDITLFRYDGTYPVATGNVLRFSFTYRV